MAESLVYFIFLLVRHPISFLIFSSIRFENRIGQLGIGVELLVRLCAEQKTDCMITPDPWVFALEELGVVNSMTSGLSHLNPRHASLWAAGEGSPDGDTSLQGVGRMGMARGPDTRT